MNAKKLLALLLTLVMLVGLIPAIPAYAAEEIVLDEEATQTQETFTGVGEENEAVTAAPTQPTDDFSNYTRVTSETFDSPGGDEQSDQAIWSQKLRDAETVMLYNRSDVIRYLEAREPYNLVLACDISCDCYATVWTRVRGSKSLDLNGHTIYVSNTSDRTPRSTLFDVLGQSYFELYDSSGGGGRINYDGYISGKGEAQLRDVFHVDGVMIMNGGVIEAGRSKKIWAWDYQSIYCQLWGQVVGHGVLIGDDGLFIMNDGQVYGRGQYCDGVGGSRAVINAGTIGGFGGADGLDVNYKFSTVRGGNFFSSSWQYFTDPHEQDQSYFTPGSYYGTSVQTYGYPNRLIPEDCGLVEDGASAYVYCTASDIQDLQPGYLARTLDVDFSLYEDYYYAEMKGVYCLGLYDSFYSHENNLLYEWLVQPDSENELSWVTASTHGNSINFYNGWADQGFVPEIGKKYNFYVRKIERFNELKHLSEYYYNDSWYRKKRYSKFIVMDSDAPSIVEDLPAEQIFYNGDTLNLHFGVAGDQLHYEWENAFEPDGPWSGFGLDSDSLSYANLTPAWDNMYIRCRVYNESGGLTSGMTRLRYRNSGIEAINCETGQYSLTGEPYVPRGSEALQMDVTCLTNGVKLENIQWQGHKDGDIRIKNINTTWPGQRPTLQLTFRFNRGVVPFSSNAEDLNVTLDGRRFDAYKNIVDDGKGIVATYYWNFPATESDGTENDISYISIRTRATVGVGYYTSDVIENPVGYEEYGDADVRYEITGEQWECDGKEIETGEKFLAYANHKLTAYLRPTDGWKFTAGTTVMFEGEKCSTRLLSDGTLIASRSYYVTDEDDDDFDNHDVTVDEYGKVSTENTGDVTDDGGSFSYEDESWKELIDYVSLSGPEVDEYHSAGYILQDDLGYGDELSFDARYAIEEYRWFRDGVEIPDDTPFEAEHEYDLMIVLRPNSGYKFFHDCLVEFNGNWVKAIRLEDGTMEVDASWYIEDNGQGLQSNSFFMACYGDRLRNGEYMPLAENFGTLTINSDYTTENTAIRNNEDGLVIYLEKDVTITYTGEGSALVLNGDTTITGPGRLTINATRTTAPAIAVNGARLSIRDAQLTINAPSGSGICGHTVDGNSPELEIEYSALTLTTASGAVYDILGNMTMTDCRVTEPGLHMGSTLGILYPVSGYNPVENVVIIPERAVQSISIGGLSAGETSLVMAGGQTRQLTAIISPADAAMQEVTWSADTNNVKVSPDGLVTAYKVGNATVTAKCGGMRASVGVAVTSNDVNVTSFDLIPHEITVGVGQTAALRPQILPLNASDPSGYWYVYNNDPHVALVGDTTADDLNEATVVVRGVAAGDADVIVFSYGCADGAVCTVHVVEDYTPAESVAVTGESNRTLHIGDTATLTAAVTPAAATDKTVLWTSSDPDVVTVDQSGNITVAGVGEATVTAEIWNGSALVSSSVDITVPYPVLGVGISAPRNVLYVGGSVQLEAYVYPGSAENKAVTWTSSNEAVATVDANGVVTAVGTDNESSSGSVTITCTTVDGDFTDSVGLTVNQPPRRVQSLTLSQNELTMPVSGDKSSQRIYIKILPENADETAWTCTVSSPLATASIVHLEDASHNIISGAEPLYGEYCYVVADLTGTANLTFRSVDGGRTARLRVNVIAAEDYVPVESVEVEESITLGIGQSMSILPTITPANASEKTVFLATDDREGTYIRVEDGRVYGVAEGYASIDVTVDGVSTRANGLPATCNIHVVKPVESLTLDAQVVALPLGGTQRLIATVGPDDAYDKTVTWTSADESVVTVDPDGTLHAMGYGTTYITAETAVYPLSTGCSVTVISNAYDLYIDGVQVTDENATSYGYDPLTRTLSLSGGLSGSGRTPFIRSEIDGMHIVFTNATLSNRGTILHLEADTTVTGTADLRSVGSAPIYVTDGATLTLDGTGLSVSGPMGIQATGTGETLVVKDTNLSISAMVEAAGGFDGGITLSGCVLLNGCRISDGRIVAASGNVEIVLTPVYGTPDFTLPAMIESVEESAFEGIDAGIVYIPDGCTSIGRGAFRSCESLTQIRIPAGCAIGEGAFDGCGTVFVFAPAGSPAQTFCADPANPNCIFIAE